MVYINRVGGVRPIVQINMKPYEKRKKQKIREDPLRDWSSLLHELLVEIAKLTLHAAVEDLMAFRGVCTSWRAAGRDDEIVNLVKPWPSVPFLLHPEKHQFYSLRRRKICMRLKVGFKHKGRKFIESRFGWVLTILPSGKVELVNPFSGAEIALPGLHSIFRHNYVADPNLDIVRRSVLSADPAVTPDFLLVVLLSHSYNSGVWFWKPGWNWAKMKTIISHDAFLFGYHSKSPALVDVNYSVRDQRFYALDVEGGLWVLFVDGTEAKSRLSTASENARLPYYGRDWKRYLLVSSAGELLVVQRNNVVDTRTELGYGATKFRVHRVDVVDGKGVCERVKSLKDAIFVGHNAAFCIPVGNGDDASVKSNSIYFTDDTITCYGREIWVNCGYGVRGGRDMGVYDLEDGSIQRFGEDAEVLSFTCPPLWVAPSSLSWLR